MSVVLLCWEKKLRPHPSRKNYTSLLTQIFQNETCDPNECLNHAALNKVTCELSV